MPRRKRLSLSSSELPAPLYGVDDSDDDRAIVPAAAARAMLPATLPPADFSRAVEITDEAAAALLNNQYEYAKWKGRGELDENLVRTVREAAPTEPGDSAFVTALRSDENTGELNGLLVYAWGESARVLADNLNLRPAGPWKPGRKLLGPGC